MSRRLPMSIICFPLSFVDRRGVISYGATCFEGLVAVGVTLCVRARNGPRTPRPRSAFADTVGIAVALAQPSALDLT